MDDVVKVDKINKLRNTAFANGRLALMKMKNVSYERMAMIISAIMMVLLIIFAVGKMKGNLLRQNEATLESIYSSFPTISSMNMSIRNMINKGFRVSVIGSGPKLRDFYVKTAYNCCATGTLKHDWVSPKALKTCIRQGARCLDFQVFSIDNKPVIAISSNNEHSVKGSYNSIPFATAMKIISNYAFSSATCPCPGDPMILHFRIMTKNTSIMDVMAKDIQMYLNSRVLGPEHSFESHGKSFGGVDIKDLKKKIVIVVDKSHANPSKTKLDEYVNMTSNSAFMRTIRYHDVKFTPDMQELIDYNKQYMSMCIPDVGDDPKNPSPATAHNYGCQFVAMSFQKNDDQMKYYTKFFNDEGSSFVLKPEELRHIPITIDEPKPARPEHSYEERKIETDFYSMKI